eukprot:8779192-Pyramimonas_sp.AAC.1
MGLWISLTNSGNSPDLRPPRPDVQDDRLPRRWTRTWREEDDDDKDDDVDGGGREAEDEERPALGLRVGGHEQDEAHLAAQSGGDMAHPDASGPTRRRVRLPRS